VLQKGLHGDKLIRVVDAQPRVAGTALRDEHIDFLKQRWSDRWVLHVE
jgi:hypothetical protein